MFHLRPLEYVGMRDIYQTGNACCRFSWNLFGHVSALASRFQSLRVPQLRLTKKASMLLVNHECPFLKDELQRHRYLDKLDMIYEVRKILPQSF